MLRSIGGEGVCKGEICKLAEKCGLYVGYIERIEGRPEYLRASAPLYLAGFCYERFVNSTHLLEPFRILLLGALYKK